MSFAEMRAQLACTGRADEMVVDGSNPHQRHRQEQRAKTICATCPLLERCRRWVLSKDDDPSPVMVVGGMTPTERRRERFGNEVCGTDAGYWRHWRRGEHCEPCRQAHVKARREWRATREQTKGNAA